MELFDELRELHVMCAQVAALEEMNEILEQVDLVGYSQGSLVAVVFANVNSNTAYGDFLFVKALGSAF
ncbi:hypothetical protein CRG98_043882 [Punica granatum]|uniref:Uncharacterized protein n=1 Tax=Punica granatum TaxID=22663 RepID=A0A2I0HVK1_PUNGR|nr:hypothetical protein CRG98_043882 [Punica granatum]